MQHADYGTIKITIESDIVIIGLNRPDVMNALNTQMRVEITDAVKWAAESGRVLVLTGEGKAFCSGQDLGDRVNLADADLERTLRDEYFPMLEAISNCPIPTIAAVNGPAAGAGANLALAFDIVIATESAYFLQAFSRIGLIPDAGGTYFLPRQIGMAKTMGVSLLGERVSAQEASDMGMIWEAVSDEDFPDVWMLRARQLALGPTEAYRRIKDVVRASFGNDFDAQIKLEAKLQGEAGRSRDFKEGVMAFVEKRQPSFEGR